MDISDKAPFPAYKGSEPFIFASYSHKNSDVVFDYITKLYENGYRIWYDEGIDPGMEWPDEIAKSIDKCSCFVVFITPDAVVSDNVRNEINFALSRKKYIISIYLDETKLPIGLEMQLSPIQAILAYKIKNKDACFNKLLQSLPQEARFSAKNTAPGYQNVEQEGENESGSSDINKTAAGNAYASNASAGNVCPKCSAELIKGMLFCIKCGTRVAKNTCPACNYENKDSMQFCIKCGTRLQVPATRPANKPESSSASASGQLRNLTIQRESQIVCLTNTYKVVVNDLPLGNIPAGRTIVAAVGTDIAIVEIVCTTILINKKLRMKLRLGANPAISFNVQWPGDIFASVKDAVILEKSN